MRVGRAGEGDARLYSGWPIVGCLSLLAVATAAVWSLIGWPLGFGGQLVGSREGTQRGRDEWMQTDDGGACSRG